MSVTDNTQNNGKKLIKPVATPVQLSPLTNVPTVLPPQKSPTDTSNWDNRVFTTPSSRLVIETDQTNNGIVIAE